MKISAMNHPALNPLEEIEWIGKNGFHFVDSTLEPPAADPDQIDPRAVRQALDRQGLGVVAHTAYYLPFATLFASIREACLGEFRRALRAARQIGFTVHEHPPENVTLFRPGGRIAEWEGSARSGMIARRRNQG